MILGVWGALGAGWARAWNRGAFQDPLYAAKTLPFGIPFWAFSDIFQGVFLSVFPGALIFLILSVLGASGSQKGGFGRPF